MMKEYQMTRNIFFLATLSFIFLLSGCDKYYLFGPTKYATSEYFDYEDDTRGGLQGDAVGDLLTRGTESIIVGWEHFYDGNRTHNHIYRGAVLFNVNPLKESPTKTITKATLNYTIQAGVNSPSAGFVESCAKKLLIATSTWTGIPEVEYPKIPETISGTVITNVPGALLGKKESIDVTSVVKDWVTGKKINNGFVFAAETENKGLIKNNDKCWTIIGDFTLRVDYTKP
jgi:hypothetical protein